MTLPTTLDGAMALLGELVADERLKYGLGFVGFLLVVSGLVAFAILEGWKRARRP